MFNDLTVQVASQVIPKWRDATVHPRLLRTAVSLHIRWATLLLFFHKNLEFHKTREHFSHCVFAKTYHLSKNSRYPCAIFNIIILLKGRWHNKNWLQAPWLRGQQLWLFHFCLALMKLRNWFGKSNFTKCQHVSERDVCIWKIGMENEDEI